MFRLHSRLFTEEELEAFHNFSTELKNECIWFWGKKPFTVDINRKETSLRYFTILYSLSRYGAKCINEEKIYSELADGNIMEKMRNFII